MYGKDIAKVHHLRKAGLGLLGNMVGDKKAVACIEDTAVAIEDLPEYITAFTSLLSSYGQKAVYYAHAGAGEIHLRPILDLKKSSLFLNRLTLFSHNIIRIKSPNGISHFARKYGI